MGDTTHEHRTEWQPSEFNPRPSWKAMTDRGKRLRPSYVWAGIQASGTAGDLRRARIGLSQVRRRFSASKTRSSGSRLRILAHLPTYVPHAYGGSESSMQATLGFLRERGHDVRIILDKSPVDSYDADGIEVLANLVRRQERMIYRWASVVLTQGRSSLRSFVRAATLNRPVALFVRNIGDWQRLPGQPDMVVFNAEWQRHALDYSNDAIVLHPPIEPAKYVTTPGDRVTLINLNRRKGGEIFNALVRRMPDVKFLAVVGVWGDQILPSEIPPNLEVVQPQADVRTVYSRTRVLLLPSAWESFGRVAVEAALSGIPVVASPNPGTIEALGDAAIYASLTNIQDWDRAVRSLEDPQTFAARSSAVARAASRFSGSDELLSLERALKDLGS